MKTCTNVSKCINCGEKHSSYYKEFPVYKAKNKEEIMKVQDTTRTTKTLDSTIKTKIMP
jgi:hypothetical protein